MKQKKKSFYHVICHIWPQIWFSILKTMWKMQYKQIENYHMEIVVLENDFNLGAIGSFFHAFTEGSWLFSKLEKCIWFQWKFISLAIFPNEFMGYISPSIHENILYKLQGWIEKKKLQICVTRWICNYPKNKKMKSRQLI